MYLLRYLTAILCMLLLPAFLAHAASLDSIGAEVTDLKFYEQPYDGVPYDQRVYQETFDQANTRYVAYEIHCQNPASGQAVQIPLTIQYLKPDGSLMGEFTRTLTVESDWTTWWHTGSWGWKDAGNWTPGQYTVRFFQDGQEIASGQFSITQSSEDTDEFTDQTWVSAFYVAYWNRAADPEGMAYWKSLIESGDLDATSVAENFALSAEAKDAYPYFQAPEQATDQDRTAFVQAVYQNLLNQNVSANDEGVRYWVQELRNGKSTPGAVIGHIIYAALTEDGASWQTISNKVAVSKYFADTFQAKSKNWTFADMGRARDCLAGVSDQSATVEDAREYIDLLLSGSLLEAADGAYVDLPDVAPQQMAGMELTITDDNAGQEIDGSLLVSKEYSLQLDWQSADGQNLLTAIPLDTSVLDELSAQDLFAVEYLDQTSNTWVSLKAMTYLDLQEGMLYVDLPLQDIIQQQVYFSFDSGPKLSRNTQTQGNPAIKLRATTLRSNSSPWLTVTFDDSPFVINYQNSGQHKIPADSAWNGTGTEYVDAAGSAIPEYIGDLHQALHTTYQGLLTLVDGQSNQLFSPKSKVLVYVRKMGPAGNADLGGPMEFNVTMDDYQNMLWTAAHEMVHVLQGDYYTGKGLITGRLNRWFIEATAQYFGALVLGLSPQEKAEFYPGNYSGNYLSVPLTANNDGSYYLLGHFLDWLSRSYSTTLVQDTLRNSWGSDQRALSQQLAGSGCSGGLAEAFEQYLQYVLTNPEKEAKLNGRIKSAMGNYSLGYGLLSPGGLLGQNRTFATYLQALRPLCAGYVNLTAQTNLTRSSLLVVEASLLPPSLEKITYDFGGTSSSQYQGAEPVDKDHDYAAGTLSIEDFKYNGTVTGMEQLIYNTIDAVIPLEMNYYILIAPKILEIQDGAILWDTSTVGNIPLEYIQGYNVYKDSRKLNGSLIPFASDSQSFNHESIESSSSELLVQLVDKHDNEWPVVDEQDINLSITPDQMKDAKVDQEYTFAFQAENIPETIPQVYFEWDFGDLQSHSQDRSQSIQVTGAGKAELQVPYTYRSDEFMYGQPESTITVILRHAVTDAELARAEAELSFFTVTIQGDRNRTYTLPEDGRTESTLDFEAIASPEDIYRFEWDFDDGSPVFSHTKQTGQTSQVSHDYTNLQDGLVLRPQVQLYNEAGELLASDQIVITIEADNALCDYDCGWDPDTSKLQLVENTDRYEVYYQDIETGMYHGLYLRYSDTSSKKKLASAGCYYQGDRHGLWTFWHENEETVEAKINYKHWELHGKSEYFNKEGTKIEEINYLDDKKNGLWITWYENGQKREEETFKDDMLNGPYTKWHENGVVLVSGYYEKNERTGTWVFYYDDGTISSKETY